MQTAKETVCRAIEFRNPSRLPVLYFNRDQSLSDVLSTGYGAAPDFAPTQDGMTEWGYAWERLDGTMGQPDRSPLGDAGSMAEYACPDPHAPGRVAHVADWVRQNPDRFLRFALGITGFNQAAFLRGFEMLFSDLLEDRATANRVLDTVFGFENALIEQVAEASLDAVSFADDWGTQHGLMISPAMWRDVFRPRYAEQFELIHRAGMKVWFHTCGDVWEIIGDLIDIGVDVLELLQPDLFGIERLGAEFGGHVCFCCAVDHQRVALTGTQQEIAAYVQRLRNALGCFRGGLIGYIEDYQSLGMREQTYQWLRDAFGAELKYVSERTPHSNPLMPGFGKGSAMDC